MDDDWDADDFVPPPPVVAKEQPKSQWDDEDKEEEQKPPVKEEQESPPPAPVAPKPTKTEKKGKKVVPDKEPLTQEEKPPVDSLAEKLRQQRLVEEADFKVTSELFKKEGEDKTLDEFIPKSEADFLEYAELVAHKITPFQKSFHYMTLLKAIIRTASVSLKAADAKELASAVTVLANEKLKAEKDTVGKKKGGVKKKQLASMPEKVQEDNYAQAYDDVEEFDFM